MHSMAALVSASLLFAFGSVSFYYLDGSRTLKLVSIPGAAGVADPLTDRPFAIFNSNLQGLITFKD